MGKGGHGKLRRKPQEAAGLTKPLQACIDIPSIGFSLAGNIYG